MENLNWVITAVRLYQEEVDAARQLPHSELRLIHASKASGISSILEEFGVITGTPPVLQINKFRECGETIEECWKRLKPLSVVVSNGSGLNWDWTGSGFTEEEIELISTVRFNPTVI